MFKTKFGDNELNVIIEEPVQEEFRRKGINPIEVFRLIESFAAKIMAVKKDDAINLTNEETGASLALDVKWRSDHEVSVQVSIVNLDNLTINQGPKSKVNLADQELPRPEAIIAAADQIPTTGGETNGTDKV